MNTSKWKWVCFGRPTIQSWRTQYDEDTKNKLSKIKESDIEQFGITINKDDNGNVTSYDIPIIHVFGHSTGSAAVNTQADKRVRGSSEAAKLQSHRQAKEYQQQIK